jgi:ubiquinone/menaquinone biosynthesis C-methylase UbiE
MHNDPHQEEKLLNEYTALAATYDRRWSAYLDASLSMTLEVVAELPAERILDVACGTGILLERLAKRPDQPELVGIDRVPAMLDTASHRLGQRATLLEGTAENLPLEDAAFQLVISTNALHYFEDAGTALSEIRRVMSPSGNLIITDWCRDYVWMKLLNHILPHTRHAHVHTFSTRELEHSLSRAGFNIVGKTRRKIDWFWGLMTIHATPIGDRGSGPAPTG